MDDYIGVGTLFEKLFDFLYNIYFPRVAFGLIYLAGRKTHVFVDSLEIVRFIGGANSLRLAMKYRERAIL